MATYTFANTIGYCETCTFDFGPPIPDYDIVIFGSIVGESLWCDFIAPPAPTTGGVACLISRLGHYFVAVGAGSQILVSRANRFGPRSPGAVFDLVDIPASAGPGDLDPDLEEMPDERLAVVWHNDTGGWFNWTDSRGKTWSTPTNPADLTQPIEMKGMLQRGIDRWPNDNHTGASFATSSDPAFSIVDVATGLTIVVEDASPGLDNAADGTFRLVIVEGGATAESHWWSDDLGKSFNKIA
jgi:hypothetical protein